MTGGKIHAHQKKRAQRIELPLSSQGDGRLPPRMKHAEAARPKAVARSA